MDEHQPWERELDALVRPALLIEPPPAVQHSILAAVLQATAHAPAPVTAVVAPVARGVPLAAYVLLAAALLAYLAAMSALEGLLGNGTWITPLASQLLAAAELLFGRPAAGDPFSLLWLALQAAPWLLLLPVAWLLWERDRAPAPAV